MIYNQHINECEKKEKALKFYHIPVLLKESLQALSIRPEGTYIDVTYGGGGHSREILGQLNPKGRLFGFDQDIDAVENVLPDARFVFVRSNFRFLRNFMRYHNVNQIDGILADLGVSSLHFDNEARGFSFRFNTRLDMRMNRQAQKDATTILNQYSEEALATLFYSYGELKQGRNIASAIVADRKKRPIHTVEELLQTVQPFIEREREKKMLAQLFQALRMEVNDEINALKEMLIQAEALLKPGGRMAVITYHSKEDRIVKNFFRSGNFEGTPEKDFYGNIQTPFCSGNNKITIPSQDEQASNPRSRSAKLRTAEKK